MVVKKEDEETGVEIDFEIDDTETFITSYVDKMKLDQKKSDAVKDKMRNLYKRCKK